MTLTNVEPARRSLLEQPQSERVAPAENAAEALVQLLAAQGVDYIFLNPGTDTAPIQEAVVALGARGQRVPVIVTCMYENVALAAALGYWNLTARPQVVVVHVDVGTQNLGGMVHCAQRGESAAVIIAGRAPYTIAGEEGALPGGRSSRVQWQQDEPDQIGIVRNYVKWAHELSRAEALQQLLPRAFQVAASAPAGPVYMTIARDVLMAPRDGVRIVPPARVRPPATPAADPAAIAEAAQMLTEAERPLAIAARVGRRPGAVADLVALADLLGMPVSDRRDAVNFPSSHPLYLGAHPDAAAALRQADVVLLLDTDVPWVPFTAAPPASARVIQIDIDPVKQSIPLWGFPVDLPIQADTSLALPQLRAALEARATPEQRSRWSARRERLGSEGAARRDADRAALAEARSRWPIDAAWLAAAINEALPPDALVIEEVTTNGGAVQRYIERDEPGSLLQSGTPALGWVLGAALGAKLAAPQRPIVAICGDGSFVFSSPIAALWAAEQAQAPFLTVIFNNAGYNASKQPVLELFPGGASQRADAFPGVRLGPPPDYALLAQSCRAYGERVEDPADLPAALERGLDAVRQGRAAVLDVILAPI
jgi:acetolactate synthase-1/2/3 large subunit